MDVRDESVREEIMRVGGRSLRVAVRPGTGTGPPLLLCNGIGMRLEAFRPFVDALDPAIEVIRRSAGPGTQGNLMRSLKTLIAAAGIRAQGRVFAAGVCSVP